MESTDHAQPGQQLREKLERALQRLEQARAFAKVRFQSPVLELSGRLLGRPGGVEYLYDSVSQMEKAGLFAGSDWEKPANLLPGLVRNTLERGERNTVILDCLSQLRMLAIAEEKNAQTELSAEQARRFLAQVLSLNLALLFGGSDESLRVRLATLAEGVNNTYRFLQQHIGFDTILGELIGEIWRILTQRPIQATTVKYMISQIAVTMNQAQGVPGDIRLGADRLVSALFGPTHGCRNDPGLQAYQDYLNTLDEAALQQEANGFARAMHDTGLVSDYHAVFLRWLLDQQRPTLIPTTLGLSSTGLDALQSYQQLIHALIEQAIYPETCQAIYGLALLLENGVLYSPPIGPGLWRQISLPLSAQSEATLQSAFGRARPPSVYLLAGVISLLGQPLGVNQGNNPTCQSARALSMWSYSSPDYLLHLIAQAARHDRIMMHFEGQAIDSALLPDGLLAAAAPLDTDPVSIILVPHLDRIYQQMGQLCADRGEDPHRWINPEFHGWWVKRGFFIAVDVASGDLAGDYDAFLTRFYRSYHPLYNGNQPIIHPQPVGTAITDSNAQYVGWHAITLLRAALDQDGVMRVYFYNPNSDSGQNWGDGVIVSTHGKGERFGEASLPFEQFLSRLYIFHDDPVEQVRNSESTDITIPIEKIEQVKTMAMNSWVNSKKATALAASNPT